MIPSFVSPFFLESQISTLAFLNHSILKTVVFPAAGTRRKRREAVEGDAEARVERPYKCICRAWHSERHEPIRGSIIQQIFRVVIEAQRPSTKSNREWKEKLPVVVLRAEEIMYSKADSEAEYMNRETLWERANEAVDMIILRDESSEKGDLLPLLARKLL